MTEPIDLIHQNAQTFAQNGSVVASYRTRGTKRYGPYYRVAYRAAGRQCSIYLGRCKKLAARARKILAHLQQPRDYRRLCQRANREQKANIRTVIRWWQQTIRSYGFDLRGCEVRGWRALGIPRIDKTTPYTPAQHAAAAIFRLPPPLKIPLPPALDPRYWQNGIPVDQQLLGKQPSNHVLHSTNTERLKC